jgi:membrane protease YdiL (CAAX protease family)
MKPEPSRSRAPNFWQTVGLLLSASHRRAARRMERQRQLLQIRSGSSTDPLGAIAIAVTWLVMAFINGGGAYVVLQAISQGQRIEAEQQGKVVVNSFSFLDAIRDVQNAESETDKKRAKDRLETDYDFEALLRSRELGGSKEEHEEFLRNAVHTRPANEFITADAAQFQIDHLRSAGRFPEMLGTVLLIAWLSMLIFQGEGLELDIQRRRHPHWEWLLSHPVRPGAVFLAEMLSPIAANPIYATGPLFFGVLYGSVYGPELGVAAAILIGVPVSIAAACVGKALEIGVMIRFHPRSRGALIGLMSWLGYTTMVLFFIFLAALPTILHALGTLLRTVAIALPWPLFSWSMGLQSDGSLSFVSGMLFCWVASLGMIASGVAFSVWGTQRGLAGTSAGPKVKSSTRTGSAIPLLKKDPLYRKEILWFLRDRGAIVQTILIPITIAGFQLFNLRLFVDRVGYSWRSIAGAAVVFGTYLLWILGPRSLASEGPALWLAQTWPRGLEELMKAKARLWFLIATALVLPVLAFVIVRFPSNSWRVLLIAVGWVAFGRSMAEKSVTLVSVSSSSGEPEPIPKGRRWAASLGMLTFAVGILGQRWELAVIGIVYSWLTAAAMWENFRARLPFLFDPWSEKVPPPPTLMHAMIAISVLVEGGAIVTGICIALFSDLGDAAIAVSQTIAFGVVAILVSVVVAGMLESRGVPPKKVWCWSSENEPDHKTRWWWSGEGKGDRRFLASLGIGVLSGLTFALVARGYVLLLSQFGTFSEIFRTAREQMEMVPSLRIAYAVIAIGFAPFAEEYLFRGLLFRALDREWGGWRALVGSAAFFAIYHQPLAWLPVFLVGLTTAFVFKKTGRLAAAVVVHMVYNAMVLLAP